MVLACPPVGIDASLGERTVTLTRFDLRGRRALVTGASCGIGRGLALALAGHGASVCVHYLDDRDGAEAVVDSIGAMGGQAVMTDGDLSVEGAAAQIAARASDALGGAVEILVANAGIEQREGFGDITRIAARAQFDTNLLGTLDLLQAVTPGMVKQRWGRIVTVGSVQQIRPHPNAMVYASLKSAVENITRNLALQLAGTGVTVNTVAPGVIQTDRNAHLLTDPAYREWVRSRIPMGSFGAPDDCAGGVILLCSDAGRYVTGINLLIDGGMHLG